MTKPAGESGTTQEVLNLLKQHPGLNSCNLLQVQF